MFEEYDFSDEERYGCGYKTYRFRNRHWTASAIEEMQETGEWFEDKDADDEDDEEESEEEWS